MNTSSSKILPLKAIIIIFVCAISLASVHRAIAQSSGDACDPSVDPGCQSADENQTDPSTGQTSGSNAQQSDTTCDPSLPGCQSANENQVDPSVGQSGNASTPTGSQSNNPAPTGAQTGNPTPTGAQTTNSSGKIPTLQNPLSNNLNSIGGIVSKFVEIFSYIVVIAAVLLLVWVGLQFILARGDTTKMKELKGWLVNIIIGVAIVIAARVIIVIIINTLDSTGTVDSNTIQSARTAVSGN